LKCIFYFSSSLTFSLFLQPDEIEERRQALEAIKTLQASGSSGDEFWCRVCWPNKKFTAYTTLLSHLRSHAGFRPYECHLCNAFFTRQHSLNYHLLIHTNETRFTCADCGRKFRHPSHFKEHRRRHTGESPYECSDCLIRLDAFLFILIFDGLYFFLSVGRVQLPNG
jgi:DNA-directed RNA polymerase subunit RPC12/RpoP